MSQLDSRAAMLAASKSSRLCLWQETSTRPARLSRRAISGPIDRRMPTLLIQPAGEIPRSTSRKTPYCTWNARGLCHPMSDLTVSDQARAMAACREGWFADASITGVKPCASAQANILVSHLPGSVRPPPRNASKDVLTARISIWLGPGSQGRPMRRRLRRSSRVAHQASNRLSNRTSDKNTDVRCDRFRQRERTPWPVRKSWQYQLHRKRWRRMVHRFAAGKQSSGTRQPILTVLAAPA